MSHYVIDPLINPGGPSLAPSDIDPVKYRPDVPVSGIDQLLLKRAISLPRPGMTLGDLIHLLQYTTAGGITVRHIVPKRLILLQQLNGEEVRTEPGTLIAKRGLRLDKPGHLLYRLTERTLILHARPGGSMRCVQSFPVDTVNCPEEFSQPLTGSTNSRDDRHTEPSRQRLDVKPCAALPQLIVHIQRHNGRHAPLHKLNRHV